MSTWRAANGSNIVMVYCYSKSGYYFSPTGFKSKSNQEMLPTIHCSLTIAVFCVLTKSCSCLFTMRWEGHCDVRSLSSAILNHPPKTQPRSQALDPRSSRLWERGCQKRCMKDFNWTVTSFFIFRFSLH